MDCSKGQEIKNNLRGQTIGNIASKYSTFKKQYSKYLYEWNYSIFGMSVGLFMQSSEGKT